MYNVYTRKIGRFRFICTISAHTHALVRSIRFLAKTIFNRILNEHQHENEIECKNKRQNNTEDSVLNSQFNHSMNSELIYGSLHWIESADLHRMQCIENWKFCRLKLATLIICVSLGVIGTRYDTDLTQVFLGK